MLVFAEILVWLSYRSVVIHSCCKAFKYSTEGWNIVDCRRHSLLWLVQHLGSITVYCIYIMYNVINPTWKHHLHRQSSVERIMHKQGQHNTTPMADPRGGGWMGVLPPLFCNWVPQWNAGPMKMAFAITIISNKNWLFINTAKFTKFTRTKRGIQ